MSSVRNKYIEFPFSEKNFELLAHMKSKVFCRDNFIITYFLQKTIKIRNTININIFRFFIMLGQSNCLKILLITLPLTLCEGVGDNTVDGSSPSFMRQVITDPPNDWFIIQDDRSNTSVTAPNGEKYPLKIAKNITDCRREDGKSYLPDIVAVTYFSDGRVLNATLWLSSSFVEPPLNRTVHLSYPSIDIPWYKIRYGMTVSTPSIYDAPGSDYQVNLSWDLNNGTWTKVLDELSPTGESRPLKATPQYLKFFDKGKGYVDLPLELDVLNSPSQYTVFFYLTDTFIENGRLCRLLDISNRVHIPPPEFSITLSQSSVKLRPGEEKNIEMQVKSDTKFNSELFLGTNEPKGLQLNFIPNQTAIPALSLVTSQLQIKASENVTVRPYTLPIFANLSFPTEVQIPGSGGDIMNNSVSASILENSNLTITVLEPMSASEHLNNIYVAWVSPISGIWTFLAGVGAVIAPLIIRAYNKKKNKEVNGQLGNS